LLFVNGRPCQVSPAPPHCAATGALRNRGDGAFEDVTVQAGLNTSLYGMGVAVGDIDTTAFPDLFITAVGGNHLFRNLPGKSGGRRYVEVTAEAGVGARRLARRR